MNDKAYKVAQDIMLEFGEYLDADKPSIDVLRGRIVDILFLQFEPIGDEEIREWAALKTGNVITDCSENYYNGVIEGAKWAVKKLVGK